MKSHRPCVLIGGRGTGKTTVLRGLSYQGQYVLNGSDINKFNRNNYIGIYFKCDTNHVHAFNGKGISKEKWMEIFAHYFNLIITAEILYFMDWHRSVDANDELLSKRACRLIATSLHLGDDISDFEKLLDVLEMSMYKFQSEINNIADGNIPKLSMAGDPIHIVTEQVRKLHQFEGKTFYILIDEYENLLDEEQQIINTLLKHTPQSYTFKIGVREMGWRVKYTMNPQESVIDPADYFLFNIVEEFTKQETANKFESFAREVCQLRIRELMEEESSFDIDQALGNLSYEEEAIRLGVLQHELYKSFCSYEEGHGICIDVTPLYKFYLAYWAVNHNESLEDTIKNYQINTSIWNTRYDNYK